MGAGTSLDLSGVEALLYTEGTSGQYIAGTGSVTFGEKDGAQGYGVYATYTNAWFKLVDYSAISGYTDNSYLTGLASNDFNPNYGGGSIAYQFTGDVFLGVIPEPSTWAMLLTGAMMGGISYWHRRRRQQGGKQTVKTVAQEG